MNVADLVDAEASFDRLAVFSNGESGVPAAALVGPPGDEESLGLFRRWTVADLAALANQPLRWRVRGMLVDPTCGMLAGEQKTLKSYLSMFMHVGLASGVPIFGHFQVDEPAPVVVYIGEGGKQPYARRLARVARAMGVDPQHIPLHGSHDVGPIDSDRFRLTLRRDLDELRPGLVGMDPFYAYHPRRSSGSSLFEEGSVLAELGAVCMEAGASLLINNHFNQTGGGQGLKRITMAGSAEWCDSWVLVRHRQDPDVENGRFQLGLDIGSRQWGATTWDLDIDLGRFDPDAGEHLGEITWDLRRGTQGVEADRGEGDRERILGVIAVRPWQLSKAEVVKGAKGNAGRVREAFDALLSEGAIGCSKVVRAGLRRPQSVSGRVRADIRGWSGGWSGRTIGVLGVRNMQVRACGAWSSVGPSTGIGTPGMDQDGAWSVRSRPLGDGPRTDEAIWRVRAMRAHAPRSTAGQPKTALCAMGIHVPVPTGAAGGRIREGGSEAPAPRECDHPVTRGPIGAGQITRRGTQGPTSFSTQAGA